MNNIARHHAEWLSLMEISGPFLSMPVLVDTFPQGLDAPDSDHAQQIVAAYEEWADNQGGLAPEPAIHHAWIHFILTQTLEMPDRVLAAGQAIPEGVKAVLAEHGETIRPDMMVIDPDNKKPQLLIHTYPVTQDLNKVVSGRNWIASPAMRMMELLHSTEIRLGLVTNGEQWMLVQAKRGETTGYISWYAGLWLEERLTLRAFRTFLGAGRFFGVPDNQTLPALLDASEKDQQEVTDQLGYQVRRAVEILIQAIDRADQDKGHALLKGVGEDKLYEAALTVMMRLVFLLTAEERDLLLLGDPIYDQYYAISTLRAQLWTQAEQLSEDVMERGLDAWCRLLATFRAVYGGVQHENLMLPAYGGSLFDPDRFPFLEGRHLTTSWETTPADPLPINNRTVLHLLDALQILRVQVPGGGSAEARRLSFRALDIEQIGHVYEGLLDHKAVRAAEPVLGLAGTKKKEPEIPLAVLEAIQQKGQAAFLALLLEETGRSESALNRSNAVELENQGKERLRAACGNDDALYQRVLPFAGLVRSDDYGWPIVIQTGSVFVTTGNSRRATGTHYTPRSLTEPIVQHTLEPLVYVGPAEGLSREAWQLRSPKEMLELKVCDMAMGSGAFLVQACRYLSERLVEAWDETSKQFSVNSKQSDSQPLNTQQHRSLNTELQITPEGRPASGDPGETIIPDNDDERLVLARRLVVDRCLYGVDKNPLAVEMAKLSLWLVTLSKNKPFTFVDHALRHGDSLIGMEQDGYDRWWHSLKGTVGPLYGEETDKALHEARRLRHELQEMQVLDVQDAQRKAALLAEAEQATAKIQRACDLLVGVQLLGLSQTEQETWRQKLLIEHVGSEAINSTEARQALAAARQHDAFHWFVEFPEVFTQGGFSAFMGNPPFLGGTRVSTFHGDHYLSALQQGYPTFKNRADICAVFILRAYSKLKTNGALGLIATNTIAQGDTRTAGLTKVNSMGGTIFRANSSVAWPGSAAVTIGIVHVTKGRYQGDKFLDSQKVMQITDHLDDMIKLGKPQELDINKQLSYAGSHVYGEGFTLTPDEANLLLTAEPKNRDILFPYLRGDDFNSNPNQAPAKWIINFFDWPIKKAQEYSTCFEFVQKNVKPYRDKVKRAHIRDRWWQYAEIRPSLYKIIEGMDRVLFHPFTSKYLCFGFVPTGIVYASPHVVFVLSHDHHFAVLQSSIHESWARQYGSTLETRLRYTSKTIFNTFPLLDLDENHPLNASGEKYLEYRQTTMLARQEGLTAIYNRFHNPTESASDIAHLRRLHVEMDNAVAAAYGWSDLDLGHGFHQTAQGLRYTISEPARREVLTRLLQLNHQRYAEEQEKGRTGEAKKGRKAPKKGDGQLGLFD